MINMREALRNLGGLAVRFPVASIVVYLERLADFDTLVGQGSIAERQAADGEREGILVVAPEVVIRVKTP